MGRMFAAIAATPDEVAAPRAGDDVVPAADVVMDRAFTVETPPGMLWPWLLQLGKRRAGWYLPRRVERFVPPSRRATRHIHAEWQQLGVGDVIPDYGGRDAAFEVAAVEPASHLVLTSRRGRTMVSWSLTLSPVPPPEHGPATATRLHLRLRLGPVRHVRIAGTVGELFDALTIAGLAAGLRERVRRPG